MKNWPAVRSIGGILGLLAVLLFFSGSGYFLYLLWQSLGNDPEPPVDFSTFSLGLAATALIFLGIIFSYWTLGYFNLRYQLDRNGLVINWAGVKQIIPMNMISNIVAWEELSGRGEETTEEAPVLEKRFPRIRGPINWPGYHIGTAQIKDKGPMIAYLTNPRKSALIVQTPTMNYLISPRFPATFLREYALRRNLGMTTNAIQITVRRSIVAATVWSDRIARWLLILAFLANVLFFAYLCTRYSSFPSDIPFHRHEELTVDNLTGAASPYVVTDRTVAKIWIFWLPGAGAIIFLFNLIVGAILHPREALAARLLFGSAFAAQIVFWLATFRIVF